MNQDLNSVGGKLFIYPIKWCGYIVQIGYVTSSLIILAHVIWYFAARKVLSVPPNIYLRNYIILPAIGLFALNWVVDLCVRSQRVSLFKKEFLSLSVFVIFSLYLSVTHDIAKVLLGSFILPIFVSTIFVDIKITRRIFWMSVAALLCFGTSKYFAGTLDSNMVMQIFVACFMIICSYLLAKILIVYGHENLVALVDADLQQRYMQEQLKRDPFTGLFNKKTFDTELTKSMEECSAFNKTLSLAMIDIDRFKGVNDLYGHIVGDKVLLYLTNSLKTIQTDTIRAFRIGGDEFAILLLGYNAEEAYRICDGLRIGLASASFQELKNNKVTFSCGIVCKTPNMVSPKMFLTAADSALYGAKNNGRNQVVIHQESIK